MTESISFLAIYALRVAFLLTSPPQTRPPPNAILSLSKSPIKLQSPSAAEYSPIISRLHVLKPFRVGLNTCSVSLPTIAKALQPITVWLLTLLAHLAREQTSKASPPSPLCVASIPAEILMQVMRLAASDPGIPHNPLATASRLSSVSRHFRRVAHGTSELWTHIRPKFPLTNDQVAFWLDVLVRSKTRPIDVLIDAQTGSPGTIQQYETFLEAAVTSSDRWRKFKIMSETWEPIAIFLQRSQNLVFLPRLEELSLLHSGGSSRSGIGDEALTPRSNDAPFGKGVVTPMLNIVRLGGTYFDYSRMCPLATNLVELHFDNLAYPSTPDVPETMIELLRETPSLRVLTLTSVDVRFPNSPQPVELPFLKRLEFRGYYHNTDILFLLHVPALEELLLGECRFAGSLGISAIPPRYNADETLRIMIRLFTDSQNTRLYWNAVGLKEVSLEYGDCLPPAVKRFLRLTKNVETLHISCADIFSVLTDKPRILLDLRHLIIRGSMFRDPHVHDISAILTNRPDVTLTVKGTLTQDGECIYKTLKDTHKILLQD